MENENSCLNLSELQKKTEKELEIHGQIFHNLMPFKVREILLVSSLYDAFIVEEEGLISEMVIEEYRHLLLSSPPRVTRVSDGEKALSMIKKHNYDLVITMSKNIGMDPFDFGIKIKKLCPNLPVILLATDAADLNIVQQKSDKKGINKIFFWNGDYNLFLSIIKYVEDNINVRYDTVNGNVRVLIMLEDSIRYYSMFLPIIYTEIVEQTQRSLSEDLNEIQRLLRRRARPKILLAETFEEGIKIYEKYKDYVLGIISDVSFRHKGKIDHDAGHKFISLIKKELSYMPVMLQSSKPENRKKAEKIGAYFLDKNSPTILQDLHHFLLKHLGFGDFVFLLPKKTISYTGRKQIISENLFHTSTVEISRVSNMKEFEKAIQKVPLESIRFHANRNDFSNWLMARGEFKLAMTLRPKRASDFTNIDEIRKHLTNIFNESRRERQRGVISDFSQQKFEFDSSFTRLGGDSLGGKGRGIAFIRALLARYNLEKRYKNTNIIVPSTIVIGTEEFDKFISDNNLHRIKDEVKLSDHKIANMFINSKLSIDLKDKLSKLLKQFKSPLAVRSSSLLEDSQNFPFAGLYSTYLLPNNNKSRKARLEQLCQAIKLIYASVFFKDAKSYIESTSSKIEEEKMAIVIQEIVGKDYGGHFYPTFSGVAQSYNFYPVSHQKREDGIVSVAVGLGNVVVGGEKVLRFSPKYPNIVPEFSTPQLVIENTQRELYALDTSKKYLYLSEKQEDNLVKLNIPDVKKDGTLDLISSTYDRNDGVIRDGISYEGPYLITFAGILKYDAFPLAPILRDLLEIGQVGMGCPVEIEFAVNIDNKKNNPPVFAILQIRPLVLSQEQQEIVWNEKDKKNENIFIKSEKALGNGLINSIHDIVYVHPENFISSKTFEIAEEIGIINKKLGPNSQYILIGPGRWGSQDRWLGIPVRWSQISGVKVMIETALDNFNIKPSQGTHFFQNIISRGISYINISLNPREGFIDWKWLYKQKTKNELHYVRHVHLSSPLNVKLDGRSGRALITKRVDSNS
ncbi:MAG: hypothetical protein JSW60_01920 [Thermoplasmatales archaeon]|nr:MAG: hypothetical protein JSW60_01920 [Thermoplasmatales archaeon]